MSSCPARRGKTLNDCSQCHQDCAINEKFYYIGKLVLINQGSTGPQFDRGINGASICKDEDSGSPHKFYFILTGWTALQFSLHFCKIFTI